MNTLTLQFALLVSLGFLAGCGSSEPRLSLTKYDQVQSEIERVSKGMDEMRASKFRTAVEVLAMHATMSATSEDARAIAPVAALNDKTPSEIIAAYEKLGPELQLKIGQQIVQARGDKQRQEAESRRDEAERIGDQLYAEAEAKKDFELSTALGKLYLRYAEKRDTDGHDIATDWLLAEYKKGQKYIVEEYCPPEVKN